MCGIAGFSTSPSEVKAINSHILARHLLRQIETRGKDATGMIWTLKEPEDGNHVWFAKNDERARDFLDSVALMPKRARNVMLHTRWATHGNSSNHDNVHPFHFDGIVGMHNGVLTNHEALRRYAGAEPVGQTDSEAMFQMLAVSDDQVADLARVEGAAALQWINTSDPFTLHLARLTGRPLTIAQTKNGSAVWASTRELLLNAMRNTLTPPEFVWEIPENTYLRVVAGRIDHVAEIPNRRSVTPMTFEGKVAR